MDELQPEIANLHSELVGLREDIKQYAARSKRDRRVVAAVAGSVLLDFLLSVGLIYGVQKANTAAAEARDATNVVRVRCEALNAAATVQHDLWTNTLALDPPPNETPEEKAVRESNVTRFRELLDDAFAPQDCTAIE